MCQDVILSLVKFQVGKKQKRVVLKGVGSHSDLLLRNRKQLTQLGWRESPTDEVISIESDFANGWNRYTVESGSPTAADARILAREYKRCAGTAKALIAHVRKYGYDESLANLLSAKGQNDYQAKRKPLTDDYWAKRKLLADDYQAKLKLLADDHQTKVKPLTDDYQTKMKLLDDDYQTKRKPLTDDYWAKRKLLDNDYQAKLKLLDDDHQTKLKLLWLRLFAMPTNRAAQLHKTPKGGNNVRDNI